MSKKIVVLALSLALFLCACGKSGNKNTNTASKTESTSGSSSAVSQSTGDLIDVRPARETGNGSFVNNVHVAASGATVISISKEKTNGNTSSETTSSSSTSSGSGNTSTPSENLPLDFVLDFDTDKITVLQLSDFMVIDSSQQRPGTKMGDEDTLKYAPSKRQELLFDRIKAAVDKTKPDLILITGDLVMGIYDDLGTSFEAVIKYMDSLKIFWAPVFGTYDNSSAQGVAWQCGKLEKSKYCLFKRGNDVGGNSNYSIGLCVSGKLFRTVYMLDSNGCVNSTDPAVVTTAGIRDTQLSWVQSTNNSLKEKGLKAPAFACFNTFSASDDLTDALKSANVDGVFMGANNSVDISTLPSNILWTVGLKTGRYYHYTQTGGMLIKLSGNVFKVSEVADN